MVYQGRRSFGGAVMETIVNAQEDSKTMILIVQRYNWA